MSNKKLPKPIFSTEIILEYHDRLIKAGINPTSNDIVKLIIHFFKYNLINIYFKNELTISRERFIFIPN